MRKRKGLTQEDLSQMAKLNLRTIQRIENGENHPREKTLQLIYDVLDIEPYDLLSHHYSDNQTRGVSRVVNIFFIIILNMLMMLIVGYLTMETHANMNSRIAAFLLSFFMPFAIVCCTPEMSNLARITRYGSGFLIYFIMCLVLHGFVVGWITGLFPCLLIAITVLYYGQDLFLAKKIV